MTGPCPIRSRLLGGIPHGFLTREGGASQGSVAGLNCGLGSGDAPDVVARNRRLAADAVLPGMPLIGPYQTHGATCHVVTEPWADDARPEGDALVTDRPGVLLSVLTADCAPVLLADAEAGVVGAAHAGWRGALAGVTDSTVAAMLKLGARIENIAAAIGPAIAQKNYEVGDAFAEPFLAEDADNGRFFTDGPSGRPHFDLEAYVAARLAAAGVRKVEAMGLDTYGDEARFYSFRRATHRGEPAYGRLISIIGLPTAR